MRALRIGILVALIAGSFLCSGCTVMRGAPSLTLLSRSINAESPNVEVLGPVDTESESWTWVLILILFGKSVPTHEGAVARFLEKHDADLVVDAELTTSTYGIPYIFMLTTNTVKGRPARFVKGGAR